MVDGRGLSAARHLQIALGQQELGDRRDAGPIAQQGIAHRFLTTVGYGDMTLPHCWQLLSVSEAVNGVLMAGWSAAQLISVVQRMMELRLRSEAAAVGREHAPSQ